MPRTRSLFSLLLAGVTMVHAPVVTFAADSVANVTAAPIAAGQPSDFMLSTGGLLGGHLLDGAGQPIDGAVVEVRQNGEKMAHAVTKQDGTFAFSGLTAGRYELATIHGVRPVRMWDAEIAPPAAKSQVVLVAREGEVRGQFGLFCDPVATAGLGVGIAGLVLGAVAVGQNNDLEEDIESRDRSLRNELREQNEELRRQLSALQAQVSASQ